MAAANVYQKIGSLSAEELEIRNLLPRFLQAGIVRPILHTPEKFLSPEIETEADV